MTETLNVFLSHKHEDAHIARKLKELLLGLVDDDKMAIFLSEEITAGDDWYDWIRKRLGDSNLLLLLFTDVTRSWDWCLYEAGLFEDLSADEANRRRVVCLTGSEKVPGPLKHLQAVTANQESVEKFLRDLYLGTDLTGFEQALSPLLAKLPKPLTETAQAVAQLVSREPVRKRYLGRFLFITVPGASALEREHIPADAPVETSAESLADLFDKVEGNWTWGELEAEARKNRDTRWLDELCGATYRFVNGRPPQHMQATYRGRGNGKLYRPVLYRIDTLADGSVVFKVLFHEDVSWRVEVVPPPLANLLTSIGMAARFRYELLDKYTGHLHELAPDEQSKIVNDIAYALTSIEEEAESRGLFNREDLIGAFDDPSDRDAVSAMYDRWFEIRAAISGALERQDLPTLDAELGALVPINRGYLAIASRRFARLMGHDSQS